MYRIVRFKTNPLTSGAFNANNFAHGINDHLIPLYALKLLMVGRDTNKILYRDNYQAQRESGHVLFLVQDDTNSYILLNCFGAHRNLQLLARGSFDCDQLLEKKIWFKMNQTMYVNTSKICSDDVYDVSADGWRRWLRLWSIHMNAAYNWHSARYMAKASNNGRSPYAIALIYRLFASNIVTKLILLQQPDEAKHNRNTVVFSNRKSKRHILNMDEIIKYTKHELSSMVTVDPNVLYFESYPVLKAGGKLHGAEIWVSPHGANMANMIFMQKGTAIIELLPYRCQRLRVFFESMASALNLKYISIEPTDASNVDGLHDSTNEDTYFDDFNVYDQIAFARRSCNTEQCVRGENWEYYNYTIDPILVAEHILIALDDGM